VEGWGQWRKRGEPKRNETEVAIGQEKGLRAGGKGPELCGRIRHILRSQLGCAGPVSRGGTKTPGVKPKGEGKNDVRIKISEVPN